MSDCVLARGRGNGLFSALSWGIAVLFALVLLLAQVPGAEAKPQFSAISVDARTGKILFSVDPDGLRQPASLTKVMTLYLLFEDLKAGRIKLSTPLRVSARAASMAPSKLNLKPGSTITVDDAIRSLVTLSANDVASAIGENLGGTEAEFAARMTKTARALGMSRTSFKNASGLPNPAQVTTARDMATLCLRIQRDFPQYYPYFRLMSFNYKGRIIKTHNKLLGRYEGTDGIKTGYIAASGYNLTSSAKRGDKRVVGVVMGSRTANSRNSYMMAMLDKAFSQATNGKTIAALAGSSKGAIDPVAATEMTEKSKKKTIAELIKPDNNDTEAAPAEMAAANDTDKQAAEGDSGVADAEAGRSGATFQKVEAPVTNEPTVIEAKIAEPPAPANLPFEVKKQTTQADVDQQIAASTSPGWNVQVGAFDNKKDAQTKLLTIKKSQPDLLKDKLAFTVTVQKGKRTSYRARFSGFTEEDARALCGKLSRQKVDCLPLPPQT